MPNFISKLVFFSFPERSVFSSLHLDSNRSNNSGIRDRYPIVKNRQQLKNNQVRKRKTKGKCAY